MTPCPLSVVLAGAGAGDRPLELSVRLTMSDEVIQLRQQVETLQGELIKLKESNKHTEYLYRCETVINLRLTDICRENDIMLPPSFFERPGK